jgi:hypothetical protein
MGFYRKKPVIIEAFKWTGGQDQTEDPEWMTDAIKESKVRIVTGDSFYVEIDTLEGAHRANTGDFIIKGIKGELYPCKPDIFEMTYDKIEV